MRFRLLSKETEFVSWLLPQTRSHWDIVHVAHWHFLPGFGKYTIAARLLSLSNHIHVILVWIKENVSVVNQSAQSNLSSSP